MILLQPRVTSLALLIFLNSLGVFFSPALQAQCHHEVFLESIYYIDELPRPPIREGIGRVNLLITTEVPLAQQYFNQGVALLHDFWEFEAYRAFKEAIRLDSTAALPYWGIYMSASRFRGSQREEVKKIKAQALEKARKFAPQASEREQYFVRSIVMQDSLPGEAGKKAAQRELEMLLSRYPDEVEAKLFLALSLMGGYEPDRYPQEGQLYSQHLLSEVLRTNPEHHGGHHYWIHVMETSDRPEAALASAEKLAALAPASGHIVHMPGHIYYRQGDYARAHEQFIRAMEVDSAYMADNQIPTVDNWNYIHNINYLIANCGEEGRYQEGLHYAHKVEALSVDSTRETAYGLTALYFQGLLSPVKLELRFAYWDKAAARLRQLPTDTALFGPSLILYRDGLLAYAEGMDLIERGNMAAARSRLDQLDALLWRSTQVEKPADLNYHRRMLVVNSMELKGHIQLAEKDFAAAMATLEAAVKKETDLGYREPPLYIRPVMESLIDAYLKAGETERALAVSEKALAKRKNSGYALFGMAQAYDMAGNQEMARDCYARFLQAWALADEELPQIQLARAFLGGK